MRTLFFLLIFLSTGNLMANYAEEFSVYIEWDFEAEVAEGYSNLLVQAKKLQKEVDDEIPWHSPYKLYTKFIRTSLDKSIGLKHVKIKYEYAEELPNGDWLDHEKVLDISSKENITFGQILYELHHSTNQKLHGQDIMAIEGFDLDDASKDQPVPIYSVFFGS